MATRTFSVSFSSDEQDFISRACPACGGRFKAKVAEGEVSISFCPFCRGQANRWETPEQLEYCKAFVAKQALQPELEKLDRAFRRLGGSGGMVKVTGQIPALKVPAKPSERTDDMPRRTTSACCRATVRHDAHRRPRFCVACGKAS